MLFLVFGPGLQVVNDRVGLQDKCVKMPTRLRSFLSPSDLDFDQNLYLELSTIFRRRVDQSTDILYRVIIPRPLAISNATLLFTAEMCGMKFASPATLFSIFVYYTEWQNASAQNTTKICKIHVKYEYSQVYVKTELITVLEQHTVNIIPFAQLTRDNT